ncbi:hypothetical protein EGW08_023342 [Elysia chlorotica]|uniref:Uncharacterized protein n=1 Tax=Elysia chlorotica TaxID=188477 RepID=A0A3S0Z422_ELYCH|nr:hypothetical protein EGW08_023342 [Elysia chlorotica]
MESVRLTIRVNISSKSFFFNTFSWIALLFMVDRLANPLSRDAILDSMVPSLSSNRFNSSKLVLESCASLSMADRLEPVKSFCKSANPFSRDAILYSMVPSLSSNRFNNSSEVLLNSCASLSMADRLEPVKSFRKPANPFSRDSILASNRSSFISIKEVLLESCAVGTLRPCFCTRPVENHDCKKTLSFYLFFFHYCYRTNHY